ncbi:UTP--glucose-1-phosphate uridylyltransferase [Snodgrassella alvi]|uniref:UTP--glucose-1-phosphate uridylyltransferase GalU n=1 Tax=Snodgrassella TaxID=1193515 RepID=UPI000A034A5D|nr:MULTISPECIES: UTP--glucose-1-phosphate uridylyltransferase GalU [Snodgrassella]MBI0158424.1 UTP--glucose-1-phosphate uridylyltransferase GalU [Snodgrassella sp. W6238H11]MBI0160989.1 UTP--glucose-1-phosphate uridylyltransferase GalU [Snodgrassella sp. W6238H14]ORF01972.1 UTP--glucose-1-phosphate uridylyltransferase [Snodgrassella alvi]ORF06962.1 UTP--glucose-1-phosphate uridylyltransferase [Snodgrassella alvi]ORF10269.1 UTP--glucose-1-phosphate uridylyltransferase [Snodgrassella alvi]
MKAVIPVAGLGTRMLPATKAIPKEMLTVADKPLIQYIVQECAAAGINEIVLVNHAFKAAIENHFDTAFELETQLQNKGKMTLLDEIRNVLPRGMQIIQVRQSEAKGLGHAMLCARSVIGDEPFAVLLPDVLIDEKACNLATDNLAAMLKQFRTTQRSQIMVERVPMSEVNKYGIVDCNGQQADSGNSIRMSAIVEKPSTEQAPSDLAVVGRYVLSAGIWSKLEKTLPGAGGEIQLTDAIAALMQQEAVDAFVIQGYSHDCGNKLGYMKTFIEYSLRHNQCGTALRQWLQQQAF